MNERIDYERAASPQYHETVKIKAVSDRTPAHIRVIFGSMAVFLIVLVYLIVTSGGLPS